MFVERPSAPPEGGATPSADSEQAFWTLQCPRTSSDSGVASCCIPLGADFARAVSRVTKQKGRTRGSVPRAKIAQLCWLVKCPGVAARVFRLSLYGRSFDGLRTNGLGGALYRGELVGHSESRRGAENRKTLAWRPWRVRGRMQCAPTGTLGPMSSLGAVEVTWLRRNERISLPLDTATTRWRRSRFCCRRRASKFWWTCVADRLAVSRRLRPGAGCPSS